MRTQGHAEQIAKFAVKIGQRRLRPAQDPDRDLALVRQARLQQAQSGAFARAGDPADQGEAAFAQLLFEPPAKLTDGGRVPQRLHRDLGGERIKFQPIGREQLAVHVRSSRSAMGR